MELFEGLISRCSIRKYTGERIDEAKITAIIKAGMYAPSARNKRPWHFIVIDDREVMKKIMKVHPYSSMLAEASHAIVVCGDEKMENGPGYYKLDCSAATQNILLAAHSMNLGAVWLGVEPRWERIKAISSILGLPQHVHPLSIVSVGVPVKIPKERPERFEPEKIRRNKW
ncbi:MAG: nitroreductase family protein [Bacteroidia bacterium]|jgi:nitroreductase|nr:nitroreductase family protein [Bacteroidia bacterium]